MYSPFESARPGVKPQEITPTTVIPQTEYNFVLKNLIGDLRQALSQYGSSWGLPAFLDKKRTEVITRMRAFLQPLSNMPDNHPVTYAQLLEVCRIISLPDASDFRMLKFRMDSEEFWQTFNFLQERSLLTAESFMALYSLYSGARKVAVRLIGRLLALNIEIQAQGIPYLLSLCQHESDVEALTRYFSLLSQLEVKDPLLQQTIQPGYVKLSVLNEIIEALVAAKIFSIESTNKILAKFDKEHLITFLKLVTKLQIPVESIRLLMNTYCEGIRIYELEQINKLLNIIEGLNFTPVQNIDLVEEITRKDRYLAHVSQTAALFAQMEFTPYDLFSRIFKMSYPPATTLQTLVDNKVFYRRLAEEIAKMNEHFIVAIEYLAKAQLLSQCSEKELLQILNCCQLSYWQKNIFELFQEPLFIIEQANLLKLLEAHEHSQTQLHSIISELRSAHLLSNHHLCLLLDLSPGKLTRMSIFITDLRKNECLNLENLHYALSIVTAKTPKPGVAMTRKESRKVTGLMRSKLTVTDSEDQSSLTFFLEHDDEKKYLSGGQGVIKKGYLTEASDEVHYSLKKPHDQDEQDALLREVQYSRMLGRRAYFFNKGPTPYMASDWIAGDSLSSCQKAGTLTNHSINQRILCLLSFFSDMNILHKNYRVHGDIKPQNCILNTVDATLRLIDFGTTRRVHAQKTMPETAQYLDKNRVGYHFADDVFSSRYVLTALFPDLYRTEESDTHAMYNIFSTAPLDATVQQQALVLLMDAVSCPERSMRPQCSDIVEYLTRLSVQIKSGEAEFTEEQLQDIALATIHRPATTVDDFLHGGMKLIS
jgi:hypothetical protein